MILRCLMIACLLFVLPACSDDGTGSTSHDAGGTDADDSDTAVTPDTAEDSGTDSSADIDTGADADAGPDCVCDDADDPCCDGCEAVNVGQPCDDGLDCTMGTVCTAAGACGDATGSPCDEQVGHPECEAAECDEVAGCSFEPIREGLACDAEGLQPDTGMCEDGECVGESCECDTDDECCDGCQAIHDGELCGGVAYGMHCDGGECVEAPCNCDDSDHPCCDGCHWTEGQVCETRADRECLEYDTCGGEFELTTCDRFCQPDDGYECTDLNQDCSSSVEACDIDRVCSDGSTATGQCYHSDSC